MKLTNTISNTNSNTNDQNHMNVSSNDNSNSNKMMMERDYLNHLQKSTYVVILLLINKQITNSYSDNSAYMFI
jgi:hypothetical protein